MGKLTYEQVSRLCRGFEYKFKNRDSKPSRSKELNLQIQLRDQMREFVKDENNQNETFTVNSEAGIILAKKLEYRFRNAEKHQILIQTLKDE
jgi:hypothetical protein